MRRSIGLALALMVGCATGVAVKELVAPARAQNATGPVYEYQIVKSPFGHGAAEWYQETLDRYAQEGWRFTLTVPRGDYVYLTFERPKVFKALQ